MGILDKFINKKSDNKNVKDLKKFKKTSKVDISSDKKETESVLASDGKLVNVPKKETKKKKLKKIKKENTGDAYKILIKSLITEKGSYLGANNQYLFEVSPNSNKVKVKEAIFKVYSVTPSKINIMNISGKKIRYGKIEGRTKHWKKAIITLPQGQKIDIQEGL